MTGFRHFVAGWLLMAATVIVCSAQTSDSPAAQVIQLTGQVSMLKDSTPWALQLGSQVQPRQIVVTGSDGFAVFRVADGSTFEVYPNSRVTFRANAGNWRDLLDLWLGRVKIHIEKLSGGAPNHNRIRTPTAVISVRGTVFDVAVEDLDSTLVSVEEGLVAVEHALLPSKEPKLVAGGEYLRVYRDQPLAKLSPNRDAAVRHGLNAVAEALYRILLRNPAPAGGSGGGVGGGPSAPAPLPGDTGNTEPPPPPPPPPSEP